MPQKSLDLFERVSSFPLGFRYQTELINKSAERQLVRRMERLDFSRSNFKTLLASA
jgi:hypothetical protein